MGISICFGFESQPVAAFCGYHKNEDPHYVHCLLVSCDSAPEQKPTRCVASPRESWKCVTVGSFFRAAWKKIHLLSALTLCLEQLFLPCFFKALAYETYCVISPGIICPLNISIIILIVMAFKRHCHRDAKLDHDDCSFRHCICTETFCLLGVISGSFSLNLFLLHLQTVGVVAVAGIISKCTQGEKS